MGSGVGVFSRPGRWTARPCAAFQIKEPPREPPTSAAFAKRIRFSCSYGMVALFLNYYLLMIYAFTTFELLLRCSTRACGSHERANATRRGSESTSPCPYLWLGRGVGSDGPRGTGNMWNIVGCFVGYNVTIHLLSVQGQSFLPGIRGKETTEELGISG